jgi:uncharacterized protein YndB with AHSA1/START domain
VTNEAESHEGEVLFLERTLDAAPEQVFAAWTDPGLLKQWWGPPGSTVKVVEIDFRVGGRYRLGIEQGQATYFVGGVYHAIEPPHKLVFTWRWENVDMDVGKSLVTIEFHANGRKTDLRLIHAQLPTEEARTAHREGWVGILEELARFVMVKK